MTFDYKKEYKELYQPPKSPSIIEVPSITYVAMLGAGDPNEEHGTYQQALQVLYTLSYTIKMSPKTGQAIEGYFPYVVPPLEGFWKLPADESMFDPAHKSDLIWISCIRLPEFVTPEVFAWAKEEASRKKDEDFSAAEMLTVNEGLCVQRLYIGPYDDEPASIEEMKRFCADKKYAFDENDMRLHHEIYLSDPRRVASDRLKTVIRIPIKKS